MAVHALIWKKWIYTPTPTSWSKFCAEKKLFPWNGAFLWDRKVVVKTDGARQHLTNLDGATKSAQIDLLFLEVLAELSLAWQHWCCCSICWWFTRRPKRTRSFRNGCFWIQLLGCGMGMKTDHHKSYKSEKYTHGQEPQANHGQTIDKP